MDIRCKEVRYSTPSNIWRVAFILAVMHFVLWAFNAKKPLIKTVVGLEVIHLVAAGANVIKRRTFSEAVRDEGAVESYVKDQHGLVYFKLAASDAQYQATEFVPPVGAKVSLTTFRPFWQSAPDSYTLDQLSIDASAAEVG